MPDPIILPNCLLNTYKLMFPTLDFSRVHFYDGIIFPFSLGSEAAITLNSFPNNIDIYLKKGIYDPCSLYTFQKLGHELVHALQAEQGFGSAWFGSWDFNYLNALGGTFSTESLRILTRRKHMTSRTK